MLNSEPNVQVSDTTDDDSSNAVGHVKIIIQSIVLLPTISLFQSRQKIYSYHPLLMFSPNEQQFYTGM